MGLNKYQIAVEDRYMRVHSDMSTYTEQTTPMACVCKGVGVLIKYANQAWEDSPILSLGQS